MESSQTACVERETSQNCNLLSHSALNCCLDGICNSNVDSSAADESVQDEYYERFRVDRRKLESLIQGTLSGHSSAQDFFSQIMQTTNTIISWPSKLKIGAKSRKDPHLKVVGSPDNVREAKKCILQVLDGKSERVTLKMDVSHSQHSHIIGKGGSTIQRVMTETECHIHFPDSNRNSNLEKSNQVSIAGTCEGVENARKLIRDLVPIVVQVDLLPMSYNFDTAAITRTVQGMFPVVVTFRSSRVPASGLIVMIKGNSCVVQQIQEAVLYISRLVTGQQASITTLNSTVFMDISPHHYRFMISRNSTAIRKIAVQTGVHIHFPEPASHAPNGTIIIQGPLKNVCTARKLLEGCLPLVLLFDIDEDVQWGQDMLTSLMEKFDAYISMKPKPKQSKKSVIVKSIESNAKNIYHVRRILLEKTEEADAGSDDLYNADADADDDLRFGSLNVLTPSAGIGADENRRLFSSELREHVTTAEALRPRNVGNSETPMQPQQSLEYYMSGVNVTRASSNSALPSYSADPSFGDMNHGPLSNQQSQSLCNSASTPDLRESLNAALRGMNLGDYKAPGAERSFLKKYAADYGQQKLLATKAMHQLPSSPRVANDVWSGLGFSRSMPEAMIKGGIAHQEDESDVPKMMAFSLQQQQPLEHPNSNSNSNGNSNSNNNSNSNGGYPIDHGKLYPGRGQQTAASLSCSNYMDSSMLPAKRLNCTKDLDLPTLLTQLGLGKYTDLFEQQEIDLSTFTTLNDDDLKDLGIATFGARRKMILTIAELKKQRNQSNIAEEAWPTSAPPGL